MTIHIEYGNGFIPFETHYPLTIAGMQVAPAPVSIPEAIIGALTNPIGSESLVQIATNKKKYNPLSRAVVVVSDNTRPVPYYGKDGLTYQIISVLKEANYFPNEITILIGAGSHRNMDPVEIEAMIGLRAMGMEGIQVVNHDYDKNEHLISLGYTQKGSHVWISKLYYEADLKIVTGLVESHFMAGASGGRKGICPAIVGKETLTLFHGARFLSSIQAADLVLKGNPLHEEASEIANMAGCDFLVNVTIDGDKNITGVFAGDLTLAHKEAVKKIREYVTVPIKKRYDIVVIPAGFVGINHYQAAKAAIEASRAVKYGGKVIVVAKNTDRDPIGGAGYKEALKLLQKHGKEKFMEMIMDPGWNIVQEQWEVQMWCKVLDVIGDPGNMYYCAVEIPAGEYKYLPGKAMIKWLNALEKREEAENMVQRMVYLALEDAINTSDVPNPSVLFLKDGPYGIPEVI